MSRKEWSWTAPKELAAQLLAQGDLSSSQICIRVGISEATLFRWKRAPEFNERIAENLQELKRQLADQSFAEFKARSNWREKLLDKVVYGVDNINREDVETMKKKDIINLALRLQDTADLIERRRGQSNMKNGCRSKEDDEFDEQMIPKIIAYREKLQMEEQKRRAGNTTFDRSPAVSEAQFRPNT